MKKKNIIYILADQQRYDTVSAYQKNEICKTPNIDWLASEGMKFNNAYTPSAICSPARASLLTGLFPHHHGVTDNVYDLNEDLTFLPNELKKQGYACKYAGKWHVSPTKTPIDCGFDDCKPFMGYAYPGSGVFPSLKFNSRPENDVNYYLEYLKENGYDIPDVSNGFLGNNPDLQTQEMFCKHEGSVETTVEYFVARETCDLIDKSVEEDKPFFIWTNFWGPHSPSIVPEPYYSMYDPKDIKEHPSYKDDMKDKPYGYRLTEKMWGLSDFGWDGFAEIAARYYGHCTMLDDMVGKIVDKLRDCGQLENTIIVYTADHGDCLGAHRLIEKGAFAFDEIYRIPMVVYGLGDKDNDSYVYLHDLMPTAIEIAGGTPIEIPDAESILPLMTGEIANNSREFAFGQFNNHFYYARQRMVHDDRYWFTFNESEIGELYDLSKDPYQINNLTDDPTYQDVKREMIDKLRLEMKRLGDPARIWLERVKRFY